MTLQDMYYGMEDKYYEIIEKISETIPINKVTDSIDKIVPSFMVFIAVIIIIILGLIIAFAGIGLGEEKDLSFKVINDKEQGISNTEITVIFNDKTEVLETNAFGKTTKIKVPLNAMVKYEINESGYEKASDEFKFTEEGEKTITIEKEKITGTKKTIKLYDKDNPSELITGKTYKVSFSCSDSDATPPSTITITDGTGEVTEPENCGTLTAHITGDHTESITVELSDSSNAIYLDALIQEYTLTVETENENREALNGIKVRIDEYYESNSGPVFVDSSYTFNGQAKFDLSIGEYKITAFDESGNYYEESEKINFSENRTVRLTLEKTGPEGGRLTIRVLDKDTQIELAETKVSLYLDNEIFEERITDENGTAEFYSRDRTVLFDAIINNEQYLVKKTTELTADDSTVTIQLEKFTGTNAGTLKVRAITIEGIKEKPIRNARIALYSIDEFEETSLMGLSEQITDINGSAEFTKVINGKYKAFAYKGTSSGWSDEIQYDRRQDTTELIITMIIPNGAVKLQIVDPEENPIPFATVTFYEEGNYKALKADKTDNNGSISFITKADKKVFFKVEKEDFMNYYSISYPVFGLETTEKTVQMIPTKRMDRPEIKIIKLMKETEELEEASSLEQGEEYSVEMQLIIPENKNYEKAGIHFRTGNDIFMENDLIFIKTINAPNAITEKYTMFDKDNLTDSKKSQTQGDAKWFNTEWLVPKAGVYNITALIKVKENALLGQELKLRFRAYGKNTKTDRDPVDVEISSRDELNAATKEKTFTVGTNVLCSEEFCFSATITDLKENIIKNISSSYTTKILQQYELQFDILNNNKTQKHYNARIQLKNENEMLNFLDYRIRNADALTRTGNADKSEIPWIDLGDFDPSTHITGKIKFITQETKAGTILIQIVSNQEIVFEKEIQIEVESPKTFRLEYEPEIIPATTSNLIEFTVFDEETGLEVEEAQIKVLDRFRDLIAGPVLTDKTGKAELTISGQAPENKLIFRIEKQEYEVFELEINTDDTIVEITPERIGMALNTKKQQSDTYALRIKNLLEFDLELSSLEFTGNFRDLLDEEAMNAWMYTNYGNIIIPSKTTKEIEVEAIISDYGLEKQERDTVDLELELQLTNGEAIWTKEIPARISIGIGGEVDDPNCLTLEKREWKTTTEGTKTKIDFGIENSCTIDGEPIELQDLEAKINWTSNHIGNYTLSFEDNPIELRSAYYKKLTSVLENKKTTATLSFEPLGGVNGTAIAEIELRARNQLDGEDQFISDKISTEIKTINLEDCIKFSNTELKVMKGQTIPFTITTTGCGSNINFTIDSEELKTSTRTLTLGPEETGPEITVDSSGMDSGRFIIKVEAKGPALATKTHLTNIYVTVYEDSCIELSRYEFDIYDDPEQEFDGYDTAQIYNRCPEKPAIVKIDMQDMGLAMRKALLPAVIGFGIATVAGGGGEQGETAPEEEGNGGSGFLSGLGKAFGWIGKLFGIGGNDKPSIPEPDYSDEDGLGEENPNLITMPAADTSNDDSYVDDPTETGSDNGTVNASEKTQMATTGFFDLGFISQILGGGDLLKKLIGTSSPWTTFGLTFVGATLYNYFSADIMEINTTVDNITVDNIKLLDGIKYTTEKIEVEDQDIDMVLEGPFTCFDSITNTSIDCWDLTFVNTNGIIQEDEFTPIMKILKTESKEHFWRTDYDQSYFNENNSFFSKLLEGADLDLEKPLEELTDKRNSINQYNRLQFNSWNPEDTTLGQQEAYRNCEIGELLGATGENAVPRIKLDWKWNAIKENSCDEGNPDYIYCDATQFSIEVLRKITELSELLENSELICNTADCSTLELASYIQATEEEKGAVGQKERMIELISFNSYLIRDGYSKDFQEDFHDYAVNTAFFDAPTSYYNPEEETGIGTYFKDNSLFEFDYAGAPNAPLQGPGLYEIQINIVYNDSSWKLFKGNTPNAKIIVSMDKLKTADPNSPLYYLPFDGEIGINSSNGRIGYGLDYENLMGDPIKINDGTGAIRTVPVPVADPIETLKTDYRTDFKKTNIDERAKIMQFERTTSGVKLIYTPSKATPVLLETTRTSDNPKDYAYAFYSITVDEQPQNVGSTGITKWSGIEANCKDFEDRSSQDYMETPDIHGLSEEASYAQIPSNKTTAYGWVWKNPRRTGTFWLETLIFSPLDSTTKMHLISAANQAKISTPNQTAVLSQGATLNPFIELNGVTSLEITSLQKILDLVESENVCVGGIGNSSYAYFFWNPKKVIDYLEPIKLSVNAEENCILK